MYACVNIITCKVTKLVGTEVYVQNEKRFFNRNNNDKFGKQTLKNRNNNMLYEYVRSIIV